jgi:hypothetical protein
METPGETRYFVAVFGDPGNPPDKDLVESGRYIPDPKYAPFSPRLGDLMLLYCTEQYPGYPKQAPGAGAFTRVDDEAIEYRWIPFFTPISKRAIDNTFEPDDARKLRKYQIFLSLAFRDIEAVIFENGRRPIEFDANVPLMAVCENCLLRFY